MIDCSASREDNKREYKKKFSRQIKRRHDLETTAQMLIPPNWQLYRSFFAI